MIPNFFIHTGEIYRWHLLVESGQRLDNVNRTHLVLVIYKNLQLQSFFNFNSCSIVILLLIILQILSLLPQHQNIKFEVLATSQFFTCSFIEVLYDHNARVLLLRYDCSATKAVLTQQCNSHFANTAVLQPLPLLL